MGQADFMGSGSLSEGMGWQTELKLGSKSPVLPTGPPSMGAWSWVPGRGNYSPCRWMGSQVPVL